MKRTLSNVELDSMYQDPGTLAKQHVAEFQYIQRTDGITWGIPAMDEKVIPLRGGEIALIVGRPGSAKTGTLIYLAAQECRRIEKEGEEQSCVIFATWETLVNTVFTGIITSMGSKSSYTASDFYWGRVEEETIKSQVVKHGGRYPFFTIGLSRFQPNVPPAFTIENIFQVIDRITEKYDRKPTLICMDYLQLITILDESQRMQQVSAAIVRSKEMAMSLDIPIYQAAQAGRMVDGYKHKIPTKSDIQHSSMGEQHADKIYALWRPYDTEENIGVSGAALDFEGSYYQVTPDLLIISMLKQRGEIGRASWVMSFDPATLTMKQKEPMPTKTLGSIDDVEF